MKKQPLILIFIKLTNKEKWDKASQEVTEDLKLINIFKRLKANNEKKEISQIEQINEANNIEELNLDEDQYYEEYEVIKNENIPKNKMNR